MNEKKTLTLTLGFKKEKPIDQPIITEEVKPIVTPPKRKLTTTKYVNIVAYNMIDHFKYYKFEFPAQINRNDLNIVSIAQWYLGNKLQHYYSPLTPLDQYTEIIITKMKFITLESDPNKVYTVKKRFRFSKSLLQCWIGICIRGLERAKRKTALMVI